MKIRFFIFSSLFLLIVSNGWLKAESSLSIINYQLSIPLTSSPTHQFTSYDELWKRVDSLSNLGLPKSALEVVGQIYDMANKERNDPQFMKAVINRLKFQSEFREDFHVRAIAELNSEIQHAQEPVKQLLWSLLGEVYWKYYQNNRFRFIDRTQMARYNADSVQTWDQTRLTRQIIRSYMSSLDNPAVLKSIPIGNYEAILEKQDQVTARELRPTLYDFIAWRALDYFTGIDGPAHIPAESFRIDDPVYFRQAAQFAGIKMMFPADSSALSSFAVRIFRDLAAFHLADKDPAALIDEELQRFEFVWQNTTLEEKDSLYLQSLKKLEEQHLTSPWSTGVSYAIAKFLSSSGNEYRADAGLQHKWDLRDAVAICDEAMKRFPESHGAKNCRALREEILQPSVSISMNEETIPERPSLASLQVKNADTVYFRIVEADPEKDMEDRQFIGRDELLNRYLDLPVLTTWKVIVPAERDYRQHVTDVAVPMMPRGYFIILASNGESFKVNKDAIAFAPMWSTRISFISQRNDQGGHDICVLDRESGRPVKNVSAEIYTRKYDYRSRKNFTEKAGEYTSDANGFFTIPALQQGETSSVIFLKLLLKDDVYISQSFYRNYHSEYNPKSILQTHFYLDRMIYRPGQTIYFKGIVLEKTGDKSVIKPGAKTEVIFRNANGQEVKRTTFVTNEFGSFSGAFIAPQGVLTGQMSISNETGSVMFQVEEYKRPTFEVVFSPMEGNYRLGEQLTVTGKASAYAGNEIGGATVKYRVVRNVYFPFFDRYWYPFPQSPEVEITQGTATTAPDGKFNVSFTAMADGSLDRKNNPTFNFTVYADVTDINGETRSSEMTVSVGYTSLIIHTDLADKVNLGTDTAFKVTTANLNGRPIPADVMVRIEKISQPERLFRSRNTPVPDVAAMSREEFYRQFPYDIYMSDNDPATWQVEKSVLERNIKTGADSLIDLQSLKKDLLKQGIYALTLRAQDTQGNPVEAKKYFTVFDPVSKEVPVNTLNWFVPLKTTCEPGETAEFLIGSKENVNVIYEVRVHDSLLSRQWLKINNSQVKIGVPVKEDYRGNFMVSFVFVSHNRAFQNSHVVNVPFTNKKLDISYETFRNKLDPGGKEEWKIRIRNAAGKGAMAEYLTTMYDQSLDIFRENRWDFSIYPSYSRMASWETSGAFSMTSGSGYLQRDQFQFIIPEYDRLNWFGLNYFGGGYGFRKGGRMMEKSMVADMAMTTPATEPMEGAAGGIVPSPQAASAEQKQPRPVFNVRKDFRETAFFYPAMVTDTAGNLSISFTVPESLTKWKILGLAFTKQLEYGLTEKEVITQKELMVFPNAPRFARQGDTMAFSAKVVNMSNRALEGEISIEFFDAITMKPIKILLTNSPTPGPSPAGEESVVHTISFLTTTLALKTGESASFQWKLAIPADASLSVLQYRIIAKAGNFSDGEEKSIPVLTNRMMVTESMPMPVRGEGTFDFRFDKLLKSSSGNNLKNYKLTLEFASNPAWYAVQALPYLDEPKFLNADNLFNAFYANSIASYIANSNPKIRAVFESWKNLTPDALLSNLEKNQQLKSAMLQETPWVMAGKSESERKQRLGLLFDLNTVSVKLEQNLARLKKLQSANGGWPWFEGMRENRYITQNIVTGLGHLNHLGISRDMLKSTGAWDMLVRAVEYLDGELVDDYSRIRKEYPGKMEENHLSSTQVQYLYARSYFLKLIPFKPVPGRTSVNEAVDYFKKQAEKYWLKQDLYSQGMIALAMNRFGNNVAVATILKSLSEKAVHSAEMGMYWAVNSGYSLYEAPVETQAMMIEVWDEIVADQEYTDNMKIWLLKQKQTQDWKSSRATVEACYALLLRGMNLLAADPEVEITVGKEVVNPQKFTDTGSEAGTGYFQVSWSGKEISPDMGKVTIDKTGRGIAWGALYWQYFEDLDKITPAQTPLKIVKELYLERNTKDGPVLEKITNYELRITDENHQLTNSPAHQLKIGDKLKVRIVLTVDRNLEFVHMKDMRASAFEPISPSPFPSPAGEGLSGYRYQDGLGYYQSTTDAATNFFFDYLPKGTWVFEYPLVVNAAGDYSNGITTVQCLYAPEFSAHSEGIRVKIN